METQLQYPVDLYRFLERAVKKTKVVSESQASLDNQETPLSHSMTSIPKISPLTN